MTGWSRQREDSKLNAWAKSQDLAIVERELERAKKDLSRAASLSLKPDYIYKRQQERARAKDATNRLSTIGLRFDLGPFLFDHPIPPPTTTTTSNLFKSKPNQEQREISLLKDQLTRLKDRESELEYALATSESKRNEERKLFQRDRKIMLSVISKLKLELRHSWNRLASLGQQYDPVGLDFGQNSSNHMYETDESYERILRPNSTRTSSRERLDQPPFDQSTRPSTLRPCYSDSNTSRSQSLRNKSSDHTSKPTTASSLRQTSETSRTRRTSLS